jgi:hypothetical protein
MSTPIRKVFIGCTDIASLIQEFETGFKLHGIETFSAVHQQSVIQGSQVSVNIEASLPRAEWFRDRSQGDQVRAYVRQELTHHTWQRAVEECDTFLFMWDTFRPDYKDLIELKKLGKRIAWLFLGDDCRWRGSYDQEMIPLGLSPLRYAYPLTADALTPKLLRLRWAEAMCDTVFNSPSQAGLALRPYYDVLPFPTDVSRYPEGGPQRERPLVIHAPSDREKKGTSDILAVVQKLQAEGLPFDFELLQGVPHAQAIERYRNADVLVGELFTVMLGKLDREFLAKGGVVVGGLAASRYAQRWPEDFPAVPSHTPAELEATFRSLLPDVDRRREIAAKGRPFIAKYGDPYNSCSQFIEAMLGKRAPDFQPTFFRERFVPESELVPIYNATTKLVANAPWYKSVVAKGVREGLEF